ncbi:hypothetical protein SHIRM173S_11266 [Streptomyces hirsutus]
MAGDGEARPDGADVAVGSSAGTSSDCCSTVSAGPWSALPAPVDSWDQAPRTSAIAAAVPMTRQTRRALARPSRFRHDGPSHGSSGCHRSPTAPVVSVA